MAKTATQTKSAAKFRSGVAVRGREAEFPSAPIRVVNVAAQAKIIDINTVRQFEFSLQRERTKLPERPSTSAGPGTSPNFSKRGNVQRETRDDLHFNHLVSHGKDAAFYNFPLPGSVPSLSPTSRSSPVPPSPRSQLLVRSETPKSFETANIMETQIGMALGSPAHPPENWPVHTGERTFSPDQMDDHDELENVSAPTKQSKTGRWKIFGGLFGGRKNSAPTNNTNFYQLQPEGQNIITASNEAGTDALGDSQNSKAPKIRGRTRTVSERKTDRLKPEPKRTQTAPLNHDFREPPRAWNGNPEIRLNRPTEEQPKAPSGSGGGLLDVNIPSVQMERYSIMFGSVLQKPTSSSSSLLTRRQATLDKLKTVNEALATKEQELLSREKLTRPRRATSPQPTKSPSFSLFPNTPSRLNTRELNTHEPRDRSPLYRSNTSPAALSPSRPAFAPSQEDNRHVVVLSPEHDATMSSSLAGPFDQPLPSSTLNTPQMRASPRSSPKPPSSSNFPNPNNRLQQAPPSRNWSPMATSQLVLSPTTSTASSSLRAELDGTEIKIYDPAPFKPILNGKEPNWQMVTPPHAPKSSISGSTTSAASTSSSSSSQSSPSPHYISQQSPSQQLRQNRQRQPSPPRERALKLAPLQIKISPPGPKPSPSNTTASTGRSRSATTGSSSTPISSATPLSSSSTLPAKLARNPLSAQLSDEENDREEKLRTAADVSIARQISVSRQQRQLLIPITGLGVKGKGKKNGLSTLTGGSSMAEEGERKMKEVLGPEGNSGLGINAKMVEGVKPITPRLVVVEDVGVGVASEQEELRRQRERMWVEANRERGSGEIIVGVEGNTLGLGVGGGNGNMGTVGGHRYRRSQNAIVEVVGGK